MHGRFGCEFGRASLSALSGGTLRESCAGCAAEEIETRESVLERLPQAACWRPPWLPDATKVAAYPIGNVAPRLLRTRAPHRASL